MNEFPHDWLCRQIIQNTPDAVIFADRGEVIRLWNGGAESLFGYTAQEALGQSLWLIIPENLRSRHSEGYRRVMAAGESRYASQLLAVPGLRKDGARISLEFSITLIRGGQGEVLGAAALIREVTARWERDRQLRQRLADLEARLKKLEPAENQEN